MWTKGVYMNIFVEKHVIKMKLPVDSLEIQFYSKNISKLDLKIAFFNVLTFKQILICFHLNVNQIPTVQECYASTNRIYSNKLLCLGD